jgi:hypothetical protein
LFFETHIVRFLSIKRKDACNNPMNDELIVIHLSVLNVQLLAALFYQHLFGG